MLRDSFKFTPTIIINILAMLVTFGVPAEEQQSTSLLSKWQLNGFATLAYTRTDKYDDRVPRRNVYQEGDQIRKNGLLLDSRIGLQLRGSLSERWDVVTQAVLRQQYSENPEDFFELAFARYHFNSEWQLGIGRLFQNNFFLSDHRNVGYSYDWVRPPTEFYGFMPLNSFDGVKITRDWGNFDSAWRWHFFAGKARALQGTFIAPPPRPRPGDSPNIPPPPNAPELSEAAVVKVNPVIGTGVSWQNNHLQLRASVTTFDVSFQNFNSVELLQPVLSVWPDAQRISEDFQASTNWVYVTMGAIWQQDQWKLQSEVALIDAEGRNTEGVRAYFHAARRLGDFQPFVTFGYARDDNAIDYAPPPPQIGADVFFQGVLALSRSIRHNQRSLSAGVRWDFAPQKAFKLQCDRFWFEAGSGAIQARPDTIYAENETRSWCTAAFDWLF